MFRLYISDKTLSLCYIVTIEEVCYENKCKSTNTYTHI